MLNKKVDYNPEKLETVQMSNDAYNYIVNDEPCLDEENIDEVNELYERYPYGFKINPDIEFVENSDLIECSIIPICICQTPFTHYKINGRWSKDEFYYSQDRKQVYFRSYIMSSKRFIDYGWNEIQINKYKKPEISPRNGMFIPLWGKSWLKY